MNKDIMLIIKLVVCLFMIGIMIGAQIQKVDITNSTLATTVLSCTIMILGEERR